MRSIAVIILGGCAPRLALRAHTPPPAACMRARLIGGAALLALAAGGCGGAAPPTQAKTDTVAAIRAAHEVGAEQQPRAAYHLELAQEQLTRADSLIEQGRMVDAERMLRRAQADAELAIALTREAAVVAEAEHVQRRIRAMRERHL